MKTARPFCQKNELNCIFPPKKCIFYDPYSLVAIINFILSHRPYHYSLLKSSVHKHWILIGNYGMGVSLESDKSLVFSTR